MNKARFSVFLSFAVMFFLLSAPMGSYADSVPDAFSFTDQTGMPLSSPIVSNPITVTGIDEDASISISGNSGEYSISSDSGSTWGSWTNSGGTVSVNNMVRVRQTSSASNSALTTTTLTIGGVSSDFNVTTAASGDPNANGLVSWWRAENNAYDAVGGNHGAVLNGATYATGKVGQAFSFDGTDDYIQVAAPVGLPMGSAARTISVWFKTPRDLTSSTDSCIIIYGTAGLGQHFSLITNNSAPGKLYFAGFYSDLAGTTTMLPDMWYHGAVTYDGTTLKLYLNGKFENSAELTLNTALNGTGMTIGRNLKEALDIWEGQIDEVKIFSRALSALEISTLAGTKPDAFSFTAQISMPLSTTIVSNPITVTGITSAAAISISGNSGEYSISTDGGSTWGSWTSSAGTISLNNQVKVRQTSSASNSALTATTLTIGGVEGAFNVTTAASGDPNASGLVSWWKAENNASDSVGGNHGTLQGGTIYASGKVGQAFSFDGSSDYVTVGDSFFPDGNSDRSVSLWIKTSQTGEKYFFSYGPNITNQRFSLGMSDNRFHVENSNSGSRGTTVINDDEWHHLVAVWSGSALKMYVDGVEQQATIVAPWPSSLATVLTGGANIGRLNGLAGYDFNGLVDEIKIFNRVLTATEVSRIFGKYTLIISKDGTGSGTVTSSPAGIDCGSDCSYPFDDGASVEISASAASGSTFSTWSGACTGNGTPCTVVMSEAREVTATFNSKTDFSGTPLSGSVPHNVTFTDTSTHSPTTWAWSFGDGGTSTVKNPVHTYRTNGTYTVTLTATGAGGASTMTKTGYVTVGPDACSNPPYKIGGNLVNYPTIQVAYDATNHNETMEIQALEFTVSGGLILDTLKTVTLKGGYGCDFTSNPGFTIISDKVTIKAGKATVENLIIK
jgi:PKD repeat protein